MHRPEDMERQIQRADAMTRSRMPERVIAVFREFRTEGATVTLLSIEQWAFWFNLRYCAEGVVYGPPRASGRRPPEQFGRGHPEPARPEAWMKRDARFHGRWYAADDLGTTYDGQAADGGLRGTADGEKGMWVGSVAFVPGLSAGARRLTVVPGDEELIAEIGLLD